MELKMIVISICQLYKIVHTYIHLLFVYTHHFDIGFNFDNDRIFVS